MKVFVQYKWILHLIIFIFRHVRIDASRAEKNGQKAVMDIPATRTFCATTYISVFNKGEQPLSEVGASLDKHFNQSLETLEIFFFQFVTDKAKQ